EHEGVVYHVQTEDKGLDTPIILSLVYVGGTILASKRSPYEDLIEQGFSDELLADRLKRQHKLICAAINSGRINDLKKMSRAGREAVAIETVIEPEIVIEPETMIELETKEAPPAIALEGYEIEYGPITQEWAPPPPRVEEPVVETTDEHEPEHGWEHIDAAPPVEEEPVEPEVVEEPLGDGLLITLLDDHEFYSGERYTLRVLISNRVAGDETPLPSVAVSIKILGTTFRPLIYSLNTESDGVASVATQIPEFTSGRAAVLVRAVAKDQAAELRRVIHPAQ
ncbi:MAG TPA: hypothetical protein VM941_12825, partial [Pyrinomonadaceae bacterium]|nr:hypothetical protein [Pyrinomonadaceae bacterium]